MFSSNHVLATTPHLGNGRILTYILSTVNGAGCRTRTDTLFQARDFLTTLCCHSRMIAL